MSDKSLRELLDVLDGPQGDECDDQTKKGYGSTRVLARQLLAVLDAPESEETAGQWEGLRNGPWLRVDQ